MDRTLIGGMNSMKKRYTGDYRDILKVIVSGYATIILINIVIKIIYGHYPSYYFKSYYIVTHIGILSSILVTLFIGKRLK